MVSLIPGHPFTVGVITIVASCVVVPRFSDTKAGIKSEPVVPNPIELLSLIQV